MIFTLQRYVFRELMRVFLLSSLAFTLMLSLGSLLRPIQEYGASPVQVVLLLIYTLPIVLTFVLPISAIFAAALVYGRFASDNELDACRASGISLHTLIYPGSFLAILVSISTLILSFHIMPYFVHKAEAVVQSDAKQICFRNISRNGHYELPGKKTRYRIYADYADEASGDLLGVQIVESKRGMVRRTIEASRANIQITPSDKFNDITVYAKNVYDTDSDGEQTYIGTLPIKYRFESLLGDNIRFKKLDEIKRIKDNPLEFYPIYRKVEKCYSRYAMELLAVDIKSAFADKSEGGFYRELGNESNKVVFAAKDCSVKEGAREQAKIEISGNIEFIEYKSGLDSEVLNRWNCGRAVISMERENEPDVLVMTLFDAARKRDDGEIQLRFRPYFRGLLLPEKIKKQLGSNKLAAVNSVLENKNSSADLMNMSNLVREGILETQASVVSEINLRLVFGIGSIILVLLSIGLGIKFKGGHLLTAFGVSIIPAGFLMVSILGGKEMAKSVEMGRLNSGIFMMWGGLVVLIVVMVMVYRKLLRF